MLRNMYIEVQTMASLSCDGSLQAGDLVLAYMPHGMTCKFQS